MHFGCTPHDMKHDHVLARWDKAADLYPVEHPNRKLIRACDCCLGPALINPDGEPDPWNVECKQCKEPPA